MRQLADEAQSNVDQADSAEALEQATAFYVDWLQNPERRERAASKDDPTATDPESEDAQRFKALFDRMTDLDKSAFAGFAGQARRRYVVKAIAPSDGNRGGGMGATRRNDGTSGLHDDTFQRKSASDLHQVGGDEDRENPLAQHGFD